MSCCTRAHDPSHAHRSHARGAALPGPLASKNDFGPIMGTWDFKWPEGTNIRVAFQDPGESGQSLAGPWKFSARDRAAAKQAVLELASRWHTGQDKLRFVARDSTGDFEPSERKGDEPHPQHRSPLGEQPWRDYDILVSLEPLPLAREDTIGEKGVETIFLPQSEIGTYARRVDFGTPTLFLGPMPSYRGDLAAYYAQPLAQMMVVHEFGHALGLAHEHQNPRARKALGLTLDAYDLVRARDILVKRFGVREQDLPPGAAATNEFLTAHLGLEWPGNLKFSDWRSYEPGDKIQSIMSVAYHECALKTPTHQCDVSKPCVQTLLVAPTDADFAAIVDMYS
jgi:hypothetical protein